MTTLRVAIDSRAAVRGGAEVAAAEARMATGAVAAQQGFRTLRTEMDSVGVAASKTARAMQVLFGAFVLERVVSRAGGVVADFESGLIAVGKTTGATGQELRALGTDFTALSLAIPETAENLLSIAEIAGQLGVRGTANLTTFTRVVAELSSAAPSLAGSFEQTSLSLARLLNLTNEDTAAVDTLTDVIVRLGNELEVRESEIIELALAISASTAAYSLASNEVLTLAAAAGALGAEVQAAGSAIFIGFAEIQKAITAGAGAAFDELRSLTGKTGEELEEAFRTDRFTLFLNVLEEVGKQGDGVRESFDRLNLAERRTIRELGRLAINFDTVAESLGLVEDETLKGTARSIEAAKAFDSLRGSTGRLGNVLKATLTENLKDSAVAMADVVDFTRDVVIELGGLTDIAENTGEAAKDLAAGLRAAAITAGLLVSVRLASSLTLSTIAAGQVADAMVHAGRSTEAFRLAQGTVIGTTFSFRQALSRLGPAIGAAFVANPILATTGAVFGLVTAIRLLIPEVDEAADETRRFTDEIQELPSTFSALERAEGILKRAVDLGDAEKRVDGFATQLRALEQTADTVATAITQGLSSIGLAQLEDIGVPDVDLQQLRLRVADQVEAIVQAQRQALARSFPEESARLADLEEAFERIVAQVEDELGPAMADTLRAFRADIALSSQVTRVFGRDALQFKDVRQEAEALGAVFEDGVVPGLLDLSNTSVLAEAFLAILERRIRLTAQELQAAQDLLTAGGGGTNVTADRLPSQFFINEENQLINDRLRLQAELTGSLDFESQAVQHQAEVYRELLAVKLEDKTISEEERDRLVALAGDVDRLTEALIEQDRIYQENRLLLDTSASALRGLGDAVGGAAAGFESFGEAAQRALQSIIANLISALTQAIAFKAVIQPLLGAGGLGLEESALRSIFNIPALGAFGLSRGGLYGPGGVEVETFQAGGFPEGITTSPTAFRTARGIGVVSEFGQPELNLRERSAVAPLVDGPQGIGVQIYGGGPGGGQRSFVFNQTNHFGAGARPSGLRTSTRNAAKDFFEQARRLGS